VKLRTLAASIALIAAIAFPAAALANNAPCSEFTAGGDHAGDSALAVNPRINGIAGKYHTYALPLKCSDPSNSDPHSAVSWWVGVEDGEGTGIVQIGVINCDYEPAYNIFGASACNGGRQNSWRFWYAFSGCGGNVAWPRDLGSAAGAGLDDVELRVFIGATTTFFYINGSVVAQQPTSSAACWAGNSDRAFAACETSDKGDSCGADITGKLRFYGLIVRNAQTSVWIANDFGSPCTVANTNGGRYRCAVPFTDTVDLYTVQ
jgi:hypothetical protein